MTTHVAVLGLGRMGRAISSRLADRGFHVTGWTRSSGAEPELGDAEVVLLALFDGPACAEVLERCPLGPSTLVVNTSTVDPEEAAELARYVEKQGARYLHAPVLGSVPAVIGGTLLVLAGGGPEERADAWPVLSALGEVWQVGGVTDAAGLKLVAAGALGQSLVAVGNSRAHGRDLGLDPSRVLDLLERTPLGTTAQRIRVDRSGPADFALGALAKDLDLLARHSPASVSVEVADPDDDVAVLAAPTPPIDPAVLEPLQAYTAGHATGDPAHFRRAFLTTAHVEGVRDGEFVSWSLDDYCALFSGRPADDEASRRRRIDSIEVRGGVATATMTLRHGPDAFTDKFVLVRVDGRWFIANKVYERAPRSQ